MKDDKNFKPYIPASKVTKELTITSIIMGTLLAIIFGAANAYLGLRVGLTVSASIPVSVISMGIFKFILKKNSILESNIVQTIGSAGESLAAGSVFTIPVIFLWANEGLCNKPSIIEVMLIIICGGVLGVFLMIPLRNALIVEEHQTLPYPEGTACAEVLMVGDKKGSKTDIVFWGMGISAVFKFIIDGMRAIPSDISIVFKDLKAELGMEIYPTLPAIGYIVGPKVALKMFGGSFFGWVVFMPLICFFGADSSLYPADIGVTISKLFAQGGPKEIWSKYIRYIGAGAIATGGLISIIKILPVIGKTIKMSMKSLKTKSNKEILRTDENISMRVVLAGVITIILLIWIVPVIPINLIEALLIGIFCIIFAAVSSRMVGLIGSSNNPVSGMTIATLFVVSYIVKGLDGKGINGMCNAIVVGCFVCIVASVVGDISQDLKSGYILGATPKKQQIGEIIGVIFSGVAISGVLYLLDFVYGYGTEGVIAPQATLMKMIVEGIMGEKLPWTLIIVGVCLAICIQFLGIPVMPFALGLYLPIYIPASILVGGIIRGVMDNRKKVSENVKKEQATKGTLYCAGMVAGEGIMGIVVTFLTFLEINMEKLHIIDLKEIGGIVCVILVILSLLYFSVWRKKENE